MPSEIITQQWSVAKSADLYRVENWSEGYFGINDQGHLYCQPKNRHAPTQIDLYELMQSLKEMGLYAPVLVRFSDVLKDRVRSMAEVFAAACKKYHYEGTYIPVYPIKVNQQYNVVTRLLETAEVAVGLEVGSKPELMASIAIAKEPRSIICNGYKDREYVRLALMAKQLGHQVILVVEKPSEIETIVTQSQACGVRPHLGVRIRLASLGEGNWQNTGGEKSKFGLSITGILDLVEHLREVEYLDCLQLLHFHMGSQIANLRHFERGLQEALVVYRELSQQGVAIRWLDAGGGLAIDYEGSDSVSFFSMNYGLQDYADVIVANLHRVCSTYNLKPPTIITEAGRAMTAHHSVLITEVNDTEIPPELDNPIAQMENSEYANALREILDKVDSSNCLQCYHDAGRLGDEVLDAFLQESINMQQRARAEYLYFQICRKVYQELQSMPELDKDVFRNLSELLADKYFCNFSIFQSVPDVWGIDQVFPIVPLQRLEQQPGRRVLLKDLTCDSDGRIDSYVDGEGVRCTLALHALEPREEYLIGIFLVGAYQEILGDMHNLFGDTHSVDVDLKDNGEYEIVNIERGDTVTNVLDIVHYDIDKMIASYDRQINRASLPEETKDMIRTQFIASMRSYTYLRHATTVNQNQDESALHGEEQNDSDAVIMQDGR